MRYLILILFLSSCSAQYHLSKAVKKGAELEKIETIKHDTTWISEHFYTIDTSIYEHTIVKYIPETRWETRIEYKYDYKRFKDSLKYYNRQYKDSLNNALKTTKIENRTERKKENRLNRFMWWFMMFFILILICYIALRIVASRLLK